MEILNETQELVKWMKRNPRILHSIPGDITSMKGRVNFVRSSPLGQKFLKERIASLLDYAVERDWAFYLSLSGFYSALNEFDKAFDAISTALDLLRIDPNIKDDLSSQDFIAHVRKLNEDEKEVLSTFYRYKMQRDDNVVGCSYITFIPPEPVEVRDYSELRPKSFYDLYCKTGIPLVMNGYSGPKWTLQSLAERIGSKNVELKRTEESSDEWACLVPSRTVTITDFIESGSKTEYLFDWSIPLNCPNGELDFETPNLFREGDILKHTSDTALYHNSWPSLFVCRAGMGSKCHVDAFASHFWMYLVKGRKKWTFFHRNVLCNLGPLYHYSLDPSFRFTQSDDINKLPRKEVILEEGQLLFVPHGWPHIVENVEDSIAVSGNFVNDSNLPHVVNQLKMISLSDDCHLNFLNELIVNGLIS